MLKNITPEQIGILISSVVAVLAQLALYLKSKLNTTKAQTAMAEQVGVAEGHALAAKASAEQLIVEDK